jgi:hypothetical protein
MESGSESEEDREWEDRRSDDTYSESSGEIGWEDEEVLDDSTAATELLECGDESLLHTLFINKLPPSALYLASGWHATGQERVCRTVQNFG